MRNVNSYLLEAEFNMRDSGALQRPKDKKIKEDEPEEIMPTIDGDKEKDILVDKNKKGTTK